MRNAAVFFLPHQFELQLTASFLYLHCQTFRFLRHPHPLLHFPDSLSSPESLEDLYISLTPVFWGSTDLWQTIPSHVSFLKKQLANAALKSPSFPVFAPSLPPSGFLLLLLSPSPSIDSVSCLAALSAGVVVGGPSSSVATPPYRSGVCGLLIVPPVLPPAISYYVSFPLP